MTHDPVLPPDADTILVRLLAYWDVKRAHRAMPQRSAIDPRQFRYALGRVGLADVEHGPPRRYVFRLVGTELVRNFGTDRTGLVLDDFPDPRYRAQIRAAFDTVVDSRQPLFLRRDVRSEGNAYRYQVLYLPLSDDDETVDKLIVAIVMT